MTAASPPANLTTLRKHCLQPIRSNKYSTNLKVCRCITKYTSSWQAVIQFSTIQDEHCSTLYMRNLIYNEVKQKSTAIEEIGLLTTCMSSLRLFRKLGHIQQYFPKLHSKLIIITHTKLFKKSTLYIYGHVNGWIIKKLCFLVKDAVNLQVIITDLLYQLLDCIH